MPRKATPKKEAVGPDPRLVKVQEIREWAQETHKAAYAERNRELVEVCRNIYRAIEPVSYPGQK